MSNQEIFGLHRITKKHLRELCKKQNLYQTPHLNDQLYLHFQGFQAIENLEEYVGLKCLWLESNAISEIQGLECQTELKCLFLQNNLIKKIENLHCCTSLDTLNLASNRITKIENCGIEVLPGLASLNLSRNYIRKSEGLRELLNCKNLSSLDLSHNRIEDILVIKIFASMPELKILVLQGNPVVSQVPQYRKTIILECKNLTYLDSRPVFPRDRACAEAWKRGGYEEERKEHDRWNRMDRKKIRDSVNATIRLRQHHGDGDAQLLESTDDEEDNSNRKKLRKIPEEASSVDLEITGVVHKPTKCLVEPPDLSSSTSPNESTSTSSSSSSSGSINENEDAECAESPSKLEREQNETQCTPSAAQQLEHMETFEIEKISAVETLKQNLILSASEYQSKEESDLENKQEKEFKSIADINRLQEFSNTTSEEEPTNQEGLIRDQFITEEISEEEKGQFEEYRKHEFGSLEGEDEKEAKIMFQCVPNNNENKTTVQTEEEPACQNEIKELFEESIQISEDFVLTSELNSSLVNSTLLWSAQKLAQEESIICSPCYSSRFSSTTNLSDCNLALIGEISEQNASEDSNNQNIQIVHPNKGEKSVCSLKENDRKQDEEYLETDFDRLKKSSILEAFASDTSYDSNEYGIESKFADSNEEIEEIFKDISELFSPKKVCKEDVKGHHQEDSPINNIMGPDSYKKNIGLENFIEYSDEKISDISRRHSPVRIVDDYDDDECDKYIKELDYSIGRTTKLDDETVLEHFETGLKEEANEEFEDHKFSLSSNDEQLISSHPPADTSSILSNNILSTSFQVIQKNKNTSSKISNQQDTSPETHAAMRLEDADMPRHENTFISTHKETGLTVSSCEDQIKAMEIFDKSRSPNCPLQPEQITNILSDNKLSEIEDFNSEDTIASSWLENFLATTSEEAISSSKNVVESLEIDNNLNEVPSTIDFQYDPSEDIIASKCLENYLAADVASKEDETSLKNFTIQGDKETEARVFNELNSEEEFEEALKDPLKVTKETDSSKDSNQNSNSCQQVKEIDDIRESLEAIIEEEKCYEAAKELDIAESSKPASFKVDQKSMKEEVTEFENCDGQKYTNEDTAEGSYTSEKENSAESLYESLEKEIKDEPINQQVGEKDCEKLRLETKTETQSLKKESQKEHLHQAQTSDNLISKSETTCEDISTELGKKPELSKDEIEYVNTKTQDVNFESLSWWEKTLLAVRSNTLKEDQFNYNHTEDSEDKEDIDFVNQDKESTSIIHENILETIRDTEIEKKEEQSPSTSKAAKQNPEENDEIYYQYSKSQDAYSIIVRKMFEANQIRKKKLESETILKFQEDGSSSDSSESESSSSSSSESFQHDHTDCSTLREVVKTFNQVTEKVSQEKQDKSELIKELIANPLTQTFSAQTSDQINHQVEELKQEQRDRISQLVDCVYAQRDKYDDTLEVVNGRLMVVKRSTGALEEIPPPPPSRPSGSTKYISCGVSATQTSCNYDDSDFDDYGTVLSEGNENDEDEDEDENDIEQHASDTKIKKILYSSPLSDVNCANESVPLSSSGSSTSIEREENKNDHHLDFDSQQGAARKLYNEIDANAETEDIPEFSEWLEKDSRETAADYMLTLKKKKGKEEILLMQKFSEVVVGGEQRNELQVELGNSTQSFLDFGEAAVLEDIALIFESPEGVE